MISTLRTISEQISRLYMRTFDRENINPKMNPRELYPLVIQTMNSLLNISAVDKSGAVIDIPSCMIATYTGITVEGTTGQKYCTLPAIPVKLKHDMGVWGVKPDGQFGGYYIPIPNSMVSLLSELEEADLENQNGFYVEGRTIRFIKDPATASLTIQLLGVDPAVLADTDPLPINADMEKIVIQEVLEILLKRPIPQDDNKLNVTPQTQAE